MSITERQHDFVPIKTGDWKEYWKEYLFNLDRGSCYSCGKPREDSIHGLSAFDDKPKKIEPLTLEVSEIFPSLQGEGKFIGHPSVFLRLRRCNLACPKCDERHTWDKNDPDWNNFTLYNTDDLAHEIEMRSQGQVGHTKRLVVTGGEPLIWDRQLGELFPKLRGWEFEIETNGTILPRFVEKFSTHYNVSPKLTFFHDNSRRTINARALSFFRERCVDGRAIFKFVVSEKRHFDEIWEITKGFNIGPDDVYIMPEGTDQITIINRLPWLFEECRQYSYNLTPRLHILAFGNQKGT